MISDESLKLFKDGSVAWVVDDQRQDNHAEASFQFVEQVGDELTHVRYRPYKPGARGKTSWAWKRGRVIAMNACTRGIVLEVVPR